MDVVVWLVLLSMGISGGLFVGWFARKRVSPPSPSEQRMEKEAERSRKLNEDVREGRSVERIAVQVIAERRRGVSRG